MDGSWHQVWSELYEEVEEEAIAQGGDVTGQELSTADVDQARDVGLLKIVTDPETSDAIRKLGRYEAEMISMIFRLLRLLEAEQSLAPVIDV